MLRGGLFPRVGAYAVLALGFWLLFQAFERSNILTGILGGALIIVGMYLMTGVWRDTFNKFGGPPRIQKQKKPSDNAPDEHTEGTRDPVYEEKPE
ncbi:MAG: hypothetical protein BZY87_08815 [SAR202 cluster bacterium Io17-Chloro-G6]|nr:MAG: hypothetical protein BZY87_08815 [SAR202 cluster bacterium Io17-Chloro-G6]